MSTRVATDDELLAVVAFAELGGAPRLVVALAVAAWLSDEGSGAPVSGVICGGGMQRAADDAAADDEDGGEADVCGDLRVEIGSCRRARAAARLLPTALALPPRLLVIGPRACEEDGPG